MENSSGLVEAIEEGKIVKVPEGYAIQEGLPILRKTSASLGGGRNSVLRSESVPKSSVLGKKEEEKRVGLEDLRKPLDWKKNKVVEELVENFHWEIARRRRRRNISRGQMAAAIGESENAIKMLENGILPKDDFILVNKVQVFLELNLRRDGKDFGESPRAAINEDEVGVSDSKKERKEEKRGTEKSQESDLSISGDEIELIE